MPAWQRFNRTFGKDGSVGIFHETYITERGNYEAIYGNMPVFGLAKATEHVRAIGSRETARRLMRGENEPAVPSPERLSRCVNFSHPSYPVPLLIGHGPPDGETREQ
jgi:hypothetical protein